MYVLPIFPASHHFFICIRCPWYSISLKLIKFNGIKYMYIIQTWTPPSWIMHTLVFSRPSRDLNESVQELKKKEEDKMAAASLIYSTSIFL